MAILEYAIISRSSAVDRSTNIYSIFEIIDELTLEGAPETEVEKNVRVPVDLTITCSWRRTQDEIPEDLMQRFYVLYPDGSKSEQASDAPIALSDHARVRSILKLRSIAWRGYGVYRFTFEKSNDKGVTWESAAETLLRIDPGSDSE